MRHTFAALTASFSFAALSLSLSLCALTPGTAWAEELQCVGVMGNSGEQGSTLVRFQGASASGLGVVYDRFGTLWDRGGMLALNRYSPDGRQIATYPLPKNVPGQGDGKLDSIALSGDTVMLKLGSALYTLPVAAPGGTAPALLDGASKIDRMSLSAWQGWVAVLSGNDVVLINGTGEKKTLATLADPKCFHIEIALDGSVYVQMTNRVLRRVAQDGAISDVPGGMPGDRSQLIDGWWYGHIWHGTIRRSDLAFQPSPGVVLGGNSGSFLGHVAENSDLSKGQGMVHMGTGNLFAVSGHQGILQLLEWKPVDKRFDIIRRIGCVNVCAGIGLDRDGRIWHSTGRWEWNDGPATPLLYGVPPGESAPVITMLESDTMMACQQMWGATTFRYGKLDKEVRGNRLEKSTLPKDVVAIAAAPYQKKNAALLLQKDGKCTAVFISPEGNPSAEAGPVTLKTATPVTRYTSLVALNKSVLLAGGDGAVIHFTPEGETDWKETGRWSMWGNRQEDNFGNQITLTADVKRLWVSDSSRHRVLCFDIANYFYTGDVKEGIFPTPEFVRRQPNVGNDVANSSIGAGDPHTTQFHKDGVTHLAPRLIATFGRTDAQGDDMASLNAPQTIAARGDRAVVFDSGNQRLLKIELRK
ncbi:MAG: hypothetical protein ACAI35_14135 [Candidatus Methylacidiphilales bacterium]